VSNTPPSPTHMRQKRYGEFVLTDAVRPGPGVPVVPAEGYRLSRFRDAETQICLPVLGASVSAEKLFDVFLELLEPLGPGSTRCWRRATTARPTATRTCAAGTSTCPSS